MSRRLISRSADLQRLRDEGYDLEVRSGYLLVKDVPYVNARREIKRGTLVSTLTLAGDVTTRPDNHVAFFIGEYPCGADGREIEQIRNQSGSQTLAVDVTVDHRFSAMPKPTGHYYDYYAKVSTYAVILSGPAAAIDPTMTPKTFPAIAPDADEPSVFNYLDTASSRAGINVVTEKLARSRIAIVGLGGSGSYVLDLVAKTPVAEIHLFDGDAYLQHNAFRSPGAPSIDELQARPKKVAHFRDLYAKMHRGIVAHAVSVGAENVSDLQGMDFVFLCLDGGSPKRAIIEGLERFGLPFIDLGVGITLTDAALGGIVRVTASTPARRDHVRSRVSFADTDGQNDYDQNIQIADLNALSAVLAVIKWKKLCGFYRDLGRELNSAYSIDVNELANDHCSA